MTIDKKRSNRYSQKMKNWFVYILECADKTLYTGITTDVKRRVEQHNKGVGAKYTRARLPVKPVFSIEVADRSGASKMEYRIKRLSKRQKLALISENKTGYLLPIEKR